MRPSLVLRTCTCPPVWAYEVDEKPGFVVPFPQADSGRGKDERDATADSRSGADSPQSSTF